jgi:hypothetical protein
MELGRGGMATVYLAERASLDIRKLVMLKVLNVALAEVEPLGRIGVSRTEPRHTWTRQHASA